MFQFRRFPTYYYLIHSRLLEVCSSGFPHSEISGSMLICSSPKLIAAYHVLHRLLMPRHSPCALCSLTSSESASASFRFRLSSKTALRCAVPPLKSKPACAGLLICKGNGFDTVSFSVNLIDSPIGSLYSWIMQAHVSRSFLAKNCIFTHLSFEIETEKKFPLLLPSHNCIIITMFSFQGTWLSL